MDSLSWQPLTEETRIVCYIYILMIYMIHLRRLVVQLRISACDAFHFIFLSLHVLPHRLHRHPLISLLFLRIHSSSFSSIIGNLSAERNQIPSCSLQGTFCVKLGHQSIVDFYSVIINRLNTSSMK